MDAYERLRPYVDDQPCDCASIERLLLVHILTSNPIRCYACKGFVDPERIALTEPQVDAVASWDRIFGSLYQLWLDSGEYEAWAKTQLLQRSGRVNVVGMKAREALAEVKPTYYWWFHESDDAASKTCPWCALDLRAAERHGVRQCDTCFVVV